MSVTVDAKQFAHAVATAARACGRAGSPEILFSLKLEVADGALNVTGTNLDMCVTARAPASGDLSSFCVEAQWLSGVSGRLKDRSEVNLDWSNGVVYVTSGRSKFSFPTLVSDAFPMLRLEDQSHEIEVDSAEFISAFEAVTPAISREETRYYLCGICLSPGSVQDDQDTAHMVATATNGHMIFAHDIAVSEIDVEMDQIIVPEKTCALLAKLMPAKGRATLNFTKTKISLDTPSASMRSKLVEGTYPNWRGLLSSAPAQLSYNTKALLQAVQTVVAGDKVEDRANPLKLQFTEGETELSINIGIDGGMSQDFCPHENGRTGVRVLWR
jgi:DNA polymerase-3 subunit beta